MCGYFHEHLHLSPAFSIVRQSTGKLGLTWPPPQADEEQRQLSEVEDFLFESFKSGIICVLHSYLLRE